MATSKEVLHLNVYNVRSFLINFASFVFAALLWFQLTSPVQSPAFPDILPHAPVSHPSQPHQGAALQEVEVDSYRHHSADHWSLHFRQYLLIFITLSSSALSSCSLTPGFMAWAWLLARQPLNVCLWAGQAIHLQAISPGDWWRIFFKVICWSIGCEKYWSGRTLS